MHCEPMCNQPGSHFHWKMENPQCSRRYVWEPWIFGSKMILRNQTHRLLSLADILNGVWESPSICSVTVNTFSFSINIINSSNKIMKKPESVL